ncbi:pollen receptor-like kinase 6 [Nymphaea colorata]|nr:pollen receptor-like kinase 6 [Nymphaea colorata]
MAAAPTLLIPLFLLHHLLFLQPDSVSALSEADALLQLKKSIQNPEALSSWTAGADPCTSHWRGVICFNGVITGLHLGGIGLAGTIDVEALRQLPGLRSVSFQSNNFSGPFPNVGSIRSLKSIFLQNNGFSGDIPADAFAAMTFLKKLWLSGNNFTGAIPSSLTSLPHLIELRLENNAFSGNIPDFRQSSLKSFNVSNNRLEGDIPSELQRFDTSCFNGNLGVRRDAAQNGGAVVSPTLPSPSNKGKVVVIAVMLVVLCISLMAATLQRPKESTKSQSREVFSPSQSTKSKRPLPTLSISGTDLIFVKDEQVVFALMDLMRAAAEVLGSDELGSSYKAVIASGRTVVVKRMKEMNQEGKEGFHAKMCRLGKIQHRNVLPPVAYHYRREEKLLVYDYATEGNLLLLLHGDRGPDRPILEWPTRIRIAQGITRGLAHLHKELGDMDLPHGNLKSTNVLFGEDCEPLIADFGFSALINPTLASQNMVAYRSPEYTKSQQLCHKSDVWCLGIILLELVTGKFPSQYLNHGKGGIDLPQWVRSELADGHEKDIYDPEIVQELKSIPNEMRQLLHVGLDCTEPSLEKRPDMGTALKKIEDIKIDEEGAVVAPSLRGALSSSRANAPAVLSSRWSGKGSFSSLSSRHDTFAIS